MKAKEIREMTLEDMRAKESELRRELFNLRMQHSIGELSNPMRLRQIRRDIARLKTIMAEKEREG